jgi:DNA-binding GntR family transcriptional regulator
VTDLPQGPIPRPFIANADTALSDQLYAYLRDAIGRGDLVPGQRLVEDTIASATAVSRTPVREALHKLVASGLAVNGGRSLVVAQMSHQQLQLLWEVSRALWLAVARLAAERRSAPDITELAYLVEVRKSGEGIGADPVRLNERIRDCLLRAASNPYLSETLLRIVVQVEGLVDLTAARRQANAILDDSAMLEALGNRDADALEAVYATYLDAVLTAWLVEMHRQADQPSL